VVRRERANLDRLVGALRVLHARLRVGGMTDAEARTLPVQIDGATLDMAGMSTWTTPAPSSRRFEAGHLGAETLNPMDFAATAIRSS
jgi:hypothetical protein